MLLGGIDDYVSLSFKVLDDDPENGELKISASKMKLKRDGKRHLRKKVGEGPRITSVHLRKAQPEVVTIRARRHLRASDDL